MRFLQKVWSNFPVLLLALGATAFVRALGGFLQIGFFKYLALLEFPLMMLTIVTGLMVTLKGGPTNTTMSPRSIIVCLVFAFSMWGIAIGLDILRMI
jgi:hypothetical protein